MNPVDKFLGKFLGQLDSLVELLEQLPVKILEKLPVENPNRTARRIPRGTPRGFPEVTPGGIPENLPVELVENFSREFPDNPVGLTLLTLKAFSRRIHRKEFPRKLQKEFSG